MMHKRTSAEEYVEKIKALKDHLDRLALPFRVDPRTDSDMPFDKYSANDWRRNTFGNALVRLRQLVENNFNFIETMGLLAVARYVFELSVWLLLFQKDSGYCLIYYRELIHTQRKYYEDTLAHLRLEMQLLKRFADRDKEESDQILPHINQVISAEDFGNLLRDAMDRVDAEASRQFSIYLDNARTNGYSFQAYLVEKEAIPQTEAAISMIDEELREYDKRVSQNVKKLVKGRWLWRGMAEKAGIVHEHDYIYSYASKLLHATPASLTTGQKNLEIQEVCLFLRYIYVKILEIMDLAWSQPECKIKPVT
jgi:hypothetical protein